MKDKELVPEDRIILSLESIRGKMVELIASIDREISWIERCKIVDPIKKVKK